MSAPLWSDERIATEADGLQLYSDASEAVFLVMRKMRDEYEARITELKREAETLLSERDKAEAQPQEPTP